MMQFLRRFYENYKVRKAERDRMRTIYIDDMIDDAFGHLPEFSIEDLEQEGL